MTRRSNTSAKAWAGAITPPSLGMTVFSFRSGWLFGNKDFMFGYYRAAELLRCGHEPLRADAQRSEPADDRAAAGGTCRTTSANRDRDQNVTVHGNHYLHAVGVARAIKYYREQAGEPVEDTAIAIASTGDSATQRGMSLRRSMAPPTAAARALCDQNNHYGISVPLSSSTANHERISENFSGTRICTLSTWMARTLSPAFTV